MDRKAWIVMALCGVLLAVNWYYMGKNREKLLEQQAAQQAEQEKKERGKEGQENKPGEEGQGPNEEVGTPEEDPKPAAKEEIVELKTEDATFAFTTHGGGIKYAEFAGQYEVGDAEKLVHLNRFGDHPVGALTSGTDEYLDIVYVLEQERTTDRSVSFLGKSDDKLYVQKTWTLVDEEEAGSGYRLKLELTLQNEGEKKIELKDYGIFAGSAARLWEGEWEQNTTLFYLKDGDFEKKTVKWFKKGKKGALTRDAGMAGYAGVANQFFATIVAPEKAYDAWVWADRSSVALPEVSGGGTAEVVRSGLSLPDETLATGGDKEVIEYEIFMGPKRPALLDNIGMERGKAMNYGFFKWISWLLNVTMNALHDWVFDPISGKWSWGLTIVALTIVIRGLMWPLQNKSTRAMKRMAKLQPEVKELKEKYPDDPQRMNQEMMALYREYGVNPLGGCLPLLVQIPIFFGFYRMLMYAVELRQQKFLWVDDLSQPDTLFHLPFSLPFLGSGVNLLPILMAATMVLQMSLTPKTGDKMQRRLFMLMPIIFFFFCYNFASALALYWTTSNIFAIVQTMITQRLPEPELKKKKKKGGKSFFEKMQARAEAAQKMQKERRAEAMGTRPKKPKKRRPRTGG